MDGGGTADDRGLIHRGHVGGPVAVRVADLVVRAAQDVQQSYQPDLDADLFTGLPYRCLRRRLADLDGATETDGSGRRSCPTAARSRAMCAEIPIAASPRFQGGADAGRGIALMVDPL